MSACPRCQQPLTAAQVDQYEVQHCAGCAGLWAAHRDIIEILDHSWRAIPETVAESTTWYKPDRPPEATMSCPACFQPMEQYGYMGLAAVTIDRCDRCARLWLDAEELQNMVLALAKANYRSERRQQQESARLRSDPMAASYLPADGSNRHPADFVQEMALGSLFRLLT